MNPPAPLHRLPAPLEAAVRRLKHAVRAATQRTVDSLGLAALSASSAQHRDLLLEAQFELNRKSAVYTLAFDEAFDERALRGSRPREAAPASGAAGGGWAALSLVGHRELEQQVAAERFGLEVAHACEWELRELGAYMGSLLPPDRATPDRHPLGPEVVGFAMLRGIDAIAERAEVRQLLHSELTRSLTDALRTAYVEVVADFRAAGVQPAGLQLRPTEARRAAAGRESTVAASLDPAPAPKPAAATRAGGARSAGTPIGNIDAQLMALILRLAALDQGSAATPEAGDSSGAGLPATGTAIGSAPSTGSGSGSGSGSGAGAAAGAAAARGATRSAAEAATEEGAPLPPNLIRAHRDELRQATAGALDHLVIDVIGALFDAILADPEVPPQIARQIARLQLPVLRAALGDPGFFSSRQHPVRRFVNRIAALGAACEDFAEEEGQRLLALVRDLVHEIVSGDFDQIETYEQKLAVLEDFAAEQARRELSAQGDPRAALDDQDEQLRLQRHWAQQLQHGLLPLAGPAFLRDFIAEVWGRAMLRVARLDGLEAERLRRMRAAGRELFMSVQPKGAPAQRKAFIAQLPALMREIESGLDLIAWPADARKNFFGQLLPAHAESLRGSQGLRTLEYNLLARQVEEVLGQALPTAADLPPPGTEATPLGPTGEASPFSAAEAQQAGLVDESAVDWDGQIDIDLDAGPVVQAADLTVAGLPAPEALEATQGAALAGQLLVGFAYRMHLEQSWQKVRLAHISPTRSFYVFTRGQRHKQAISMTSRMLLRLCESGRLQAFEAAYLVDRATARARRQLAALGGSAS